MITVGRNMPAHPTSNQVTVELYLTAPDGSMVHMKLSYTSLCVPQTIQAQARSHSGELLSEAQLDLTVQIPLSMTLDVRGGQLAVGREITIFPHGPGVCNLSSPVSLSSLC